MNTKLKIVIKGKIFSCDVEAIDIDHIDYDEENPRIGLYRDTHSYEKHLKREEIEFALQKNSLSYEKLKEAIEVNEGAWMPIWIIQTSPDRYMVIEGNTRLLIYNELREKYPNKETFQKINCIILPYKEVSDEQRDYIKLSAHLRGHNDWDLYEKARCLYLLWDKKGRTVKQLSRDTKLNENDIKSSIEAYKNMEQQYLPRYGKTDPSAQIHKFSYFLEYQKDRELQRIMNDKNLNINNFCDWVGSGKFSRGQEVRRLAEVLEDEKSREAFIQKGFEEAIQVLSYIKPETDSELYESIIETTQQLTEIPPGEIDELRDKKKFSKKRELIFELNEKLKIVLGLIGR